MKLTTLKPRVATLASALPVMEPNSSWRAKPRGQGLYTYRWKKARAAYLREHPLCVICKRTGKIQVASVVDHKIPHRGNEELFWDAEHNWQSLCKSCHDSKTAKYDSGFGNPKRG
jgi:5-methylcytosine-specific restriction enzyme A